MNTASATFPGSRREYTYLTQLDLKVGDTCIVKAPKGLAAVTITAVPATVPVDPNAKFEYKEIKQRIYFAKNGPLIIASQAEHSATGDTKENAIANLLYKLQQLQ